MAESKRASQASVVPYRIAASGVEFCLITTRRSRQWGFPKGRIGRHKTVEDVGLLEAYEEAGVTGRIVGEPLGQYAYNKDGRRWSVTVMLMEVNGCIDHWKESHQRLRRWAPLHEASFLLARPKLIQLLQKAVERLASKVHEVR